MSDNNDLDYKPVTFFDSKGNVISNDPVYQAQKTLEAAFGKAGQPQPAAFLKNNDDEPIDTSPYADMNGRELKAAAKERGVDITGMKTVGEVRAALVAADENSSSDDNTDKSDAKDE